MKGLIEMLPTIDLGGLPANRPASLDLARRPVVGDFREALAAARRRLNPSDARQRDKGAEVDAPRDETASPDTPAPGDTAKEAYVYAAGAPGTTAGERAPGAAVEGNAGASSVQATSEGTSGGAGAPGALAARAGMAQEAGVDATGGQGQGSQPPPGIGARDHASLPLALERPGAAQGGVATEEGPQPGRASHPGGARSALEPGQQDVPERDGQTPLWRTVSTGPVGVATGAGAAASPGERKGPAPAPQVDAPNAEVPASGLRRPVSGRSYGALRTLVESLEAGNSLDANGEPAASSAAERLTSVLGMAAAGAGQVRGVGESAARAAAIASDLAGEALVLAAGERSLGPAADAAQDGAPAVAGVGSAAQDQTGMAAGRSSDVLAAGDGDAEPGGIVEASGVVDPQDGELKELSKGHTREALGGRPGEESSGSKADGRPGAFEAPGDRWTTGEHHSFESAVRGDATPRAISETAPFEPLETRQDAAPGTSSPAWVRRLEGVTQSALEQMVRHVEGEVQGDSASLRFHLVPGRLGQLELKLEVEQGILTARFVAASEEVRALIESALPDLRRHLAESGIAVSELAVSVGQSNQDRGSHAESGSRRGAPAVRGGGARAAAYDGPAAEVRPVLSGLYSVDVLV